MSSKTRVNRLFLASIASSLNLGWDRGQMPVYYLTKKKGLGSDSYTRNNAIDFSIRIFSSRSLCPVNDYKLAPYYKGLKCNWWNILRWNRRGGLKLVKLQLWLPHHHISPLLSTAEQVNIGLPNWFPAWPVRRHLHPTTTSTAYLITFSITIIGVHST